MSSLCGANGGKLAAQVCRLPEHLQQMLPDESRAYMQPDNLRPFSLRHAIQQASIVGNMLAAGLLKVCFNENLAGCQLFFLPEEPYFLTLAVTDIRTES